MNRPKRRRHRDNPYYLLYEESENKYYILFKDGKGIINKVEVSAYIYDAFNRFELDDLSELNEYDNHIEHLELNEETLYLRSKEKPVQIDDQIIRKTTYESLMKAINQLPEIQKRRIKKYYFDEKNEYEIAQEEGTSHVAIHYSLNIAIKSLKEILKNFKNWLTNLKIS